TATHALPDVVLRFEQGAQSLPTDKFSDRVSDPLQARLDRPRLLEGNFERLLLLVRIELSGPPTAWVIVQPRHLLRLPPLQPLTRPSPIDLVDGGKLFQRVTALTEQHRGRLHVRAVTGGGFLNRAQFPGLFGRECPHKSDRRVETGNSRAESIRAGLDV